MKIDYKKELESASKSMIMIHDPKLLIKLIVRMIVHKLNIKHAAMILYEPEKNAYILDISRGKTGVKIPTGFARFDKNSPLIKLFNKKEFKSLNLNGNAVLSEDINRLLWKETLIGTKTSASTKELLNQVDEQIRLLGVSACVPAYYQHELMAVLLLGEKDDGIKFETDELDFFAALASDAAMAIRNAQLFEHVKKEAERNRELFIQTIIVLGSTIEAKDPYTHGHTERVTRYALAIAQQMVENGSTEFDKSFFENLYIAGMMHDIGKIAVQESILNKKGKLTQAEYLEMKQHTTRVAEMVKPLNLAKECVDGIKYHHENFDGSGYPEGLTGAAIPIGAAIVAVADAFDAVTTDRPYRQGLKKETAVEEIKKKGGAQFNPIPVKALLELWEKGKI